jgi:DnaD/phage-associated family protein
MTPFQGLPGGKLEITPLPNLFFSELIPQIDDLAELKVTLHVYWLLHRKKGSPRYVTLSELRADATLMRGVGTVDNLTRGLHQARERGTLLVAEANEDAYYFFNTDESRRALEKIARGELTLAPGAAIREPARMEKMPNIFELYEQNIGLLTPLISEELQEAEKTFPAAWIPAAFKEAVALNKRSWRYVRKILENWARAGRGEKIGRATDKRRQPAIEGKYADDLKR